MAVNTRAMPTTNLNSNPMAYQSFRPKKFPLDPFADRSKSQDVKIPVQSNDNQNAVILPWSVDTESIPRLVSRQRARENVVLVIGGK